MADLAMVFHWSLADMTAMSMPDLVEWREMARQRAEPDDD